MGKSYEDLQVWQRSRELAVRICRELKDCRDFALKDQITRSSISVPSNIAEGAERNSVAEFKQFIGYAKGSLAELRTQISIASDLNYVDSTLALELLEEAEQLSKMLFRLSQGLGKPS